jgi:hypothetical protein
VTAISGILGARRYSVRGAQIGDADSTICPYVAIYEIEADDLADVMDEVSARIAAGQITRSDAISQDPAPIVMICDLIE